MTEQSPLLQPRYKVEQPYPKSPFKVGDILIFIPQFMQRTDGTIKSTTYGDVFKTASGSIRASEIDKYPAIFRKMEWWEERKPEEMPEYVKITDTGIVVKVNQRNKNNPADVYAVDINEEWVGWVHMQDCTPSSLSEYQERI